MKPSMKRLLWTGAVSVLTLTGCSFANEGELQQWMEDLQKTMRPNTQPVPEPKEFSPQTYSGRGTVDPFDPQKVVMAVARQAQARASASAIKPDLDRRRETLEGFPLDQIRMVLVTSKTAHARAGSVDKSKSTGQQPRRFLFPVLIDLVTGGQP